VGFEGTDYPALTWHTGTGSAGFITLPKVAVAAGDGVRAYFGDVTSAEVLEHLGIGKAKELVLTVNDPDAALRAVKLSRRLSPDLRIIVRAAYLDDVARMLEAGASEVVTAEAESAVEVTHIILKGHGADEATVERHLSRIRSRKAEVAS